MNREKLKEIASVILDLGMELEYQRRHPREKEIELDNIEFNFDGEGECTVYHNDGRLGTISIDPDQINVNVIYRNKKLELFTESDKRLAPRDIMDIIGDFIDYDYREDVLLRTESPKLQQPVQQEFPIRKWLLNTFLEHMYGERPEAEQGLLYGEWCSKVAGISQAFFIDIQTPSLHDISDMSFVNTIGQLGYLPRENMSDNLRVVVNLLNDVGKLPEPIKALVKDLLPTSK